MASTSTNTLTPETHSTRPRRSTRAAARRQKESNAENDDETEIEVGNPTDRRRKGKAKAKPALVARKRKRTEEAVGDSGEDEEPEEADKKRAKGGPNNEDSIRAGQANGGEVAGDQPAISAQRSQDLNYFLSRALRSSKTLLVHMETLRQENERLKETNNAFQQEIDDLAKPRRNNAKNKDIARIKQLERQIRELMEARAKDRKRLDKYEKDALNREVEELGGAAQNQGTNPGSLQSRALKMREMLDQLTDLIKQPCLHGNPQEDQCNICLEPLQITKVGSLPCDHLYCHSCIEGVKRERFSDAGQDASSDGGDSREVVNCPECRKEFSMDDIIDVKYTASKQWDEITILATEWARLSNEWAATDDVEPDNEPILDVARLTTDEEGDDGPIVVDEEEGDDGPIVVDEEEGEEEEEEEEILPRRRLHRASQEVGSSNCQVQPATQDAPLTRQASDAGDDEENTSQNPSPPRRQRRDVVESEGEDYEEKASDRSLSPINEPRRRLPTTSQGRAAVKKFLKV